MSVRTLTTVGMSAALCLALAGCTRASGEPEGIRSGSTDSASPQATGVVAAAVGQCREYTWEQSQGGSEDSQPVECTGDHTAETYYVATVPDSMFPDFEASWDAEDRGAPAFEPTAIDELFDRCDGLVDEFVGWEPTMIPNRFGWTRFGPSRQSWAAGDRTVRCDVVSRHLSVKSGEVVRTLRQLPGEPLKGYVKPSNVGSWKTCANWASSTGLKSLGSCKDAKDSQVRVGEKVVGTDDTPWLGKAAVDRKLRTWCKPLAEQHGSGPGSGWMFSGPSKPEWESGNRLAACFVAEQDWNGVAF